MSPCAGSTTRKAGSADERIYHGSAALKTLGEMYAFSGEGKTSLYWFQEAVDKEASDEGNSAASYNIGYFYDNGLYVEKDHEEARKWYQKAEDQGDAPSYHIEE